MVLKTLSILRDSFFSGRKLQHDDYTTIVYHHGNEYVLHDGLQLRPAKVTEDTGRQPFSESEQGVRPTDDSVAGHGVKDSWATASTVEYGLTDSQTFASAHDWLKSSGINPATGLLMVNDAFDIAGIPWGADGSDLGFIEPHDSFSDDDFLGHT